MEGSLDAQTVAAIVAEVEERGGLLEAPFASPSGPRVSPRRLSLKHALDGDLAALLLVMLSPLLILVAALVKATSPGPVLFRQQRVGKDGRGFVIFKFRSMRQATRLVRFEPAPGLAPGGVEGEDRRTAVGRLIRVLSIDELPQLFNVLRGEMSLVGPRPERPRYVERFSQQLLGYADRHAVRPGITGWAQVHGCRGATSIKDRLELDLEYIQFWSLWLDLKILVRTAVSLIGMALPRRRSGHIEAVMEVIGRRQPALRAEGASDR